MFPVEKERHLTEDPLQTLLFLIQEEWQVRVENQQG